MQLTRAADYGLRGMLYLAREPADKMVMASVIAESEDMPEHFFSKILQNLAKSGLVNSLRGSSGGFSLARPPENITVLEVVEALEGPVSLSRCVSAPHTCPKSPTCPFRKYWEEAQESLLSIFGNYTLADAVAYAEAAESE